MSLTREVAPRSNRSGRARAGLLGAGDSNPSGMLEMPVLFRMPDVAELKTPATSPPTKAPQSASPAEADPSWPETASGVISATIPAAAPISDPTARPQIESPQPVATAPTTNSPPRTVGKKAATWFDSHTKLLLVCFLVALTAVIYLARHKRRQNSPLSQPSAPSKDWPDAQSGEVTEPPPLSLEQPATPDAMIAAELTPLRATTALHAGEMSESGSSAPLATSAIAPPGSLDNALFPWKQSDAAARIASRSNQLAPEREANADADRGPPVLPPVIPPVPSPTPTNSPRGYQYERTGSGLY